MLKNVMGNEMILCTKGCKKETRNKTSYTLNKQLINFHIKLNGYSNPYYKNYTVETILLFDIVIPIRPYQDDTFYNIDIFNDDDN